MTVFANDPDLLRRFRAGDREALAHVYWFYVARVESVVRRAFALSQGPSVPNAGMRADIADLVQETFVRAFSSASRVAYDGIREYRPLLVTIARNAFTDHMRRLGRELRVDPADLERFLESERPGVPEEPRGSDPQTLALVERYLNNLPVRERAVYVERYVNGRSQVHAAEGLGMSRQQLRTLEGRVRTGLSRELARAEGGPAEDFATKGQSYPPKAAPVRIRTEGK